MYVNYVCINEGFYRHMYVHSKNLFLIFQKQGVLCVYTIIFFFFFTYKKWKIDNTIIYFVKAQKTPFFQITFFSFLIIAVYVRRTYTLQAYDYAICITYDQLRLVSHPQHLSWGKLPETVSFKSAPTACLMI